MTSATLKALIDVYGILVKAGWGEPELRKNEPELRDLEKAIAQSKARVTEIFEQLEQQAADEFHELRSAAG